jgi:hypothetical protein
MSVFLPSTETLVLPHVDEPVARRTEVRDAILNGGDWRQELSDEVGLGALLWKDWGQALGAEGMDRPTFTDVVIGYERELWFWLMGERQWDEVLSGLAGRTGRRLPTS